MKDEVIDPDPKGTCHGLLGQDGWRGRCCKSNVKVIRDGLGYCRLHDPKGNFQTRTPREFDDPLADLPALEKCPFCRRTPVLIKEWINAGRFEWRVGCDFDRCAVRCYTKGGSNAKAAIARWNRRDGKSSWSK